MGFQSAPGFASALQGLFGTTSASKRRLFIDLYRWTRAVVRAAVGALIFLPGPVSGEDIHFVEVEATGASLEDARRNAVRAALQETMDQLVLAERAVEDGRLVKDRLLSTVNGFIREFEILETVEGELEYRVRARVGVSNADIENYVDYLDPSGPSGVDGESVFQEIDRRKLEAASLRRILRHLVRGVPLYRFSVAVDEVVPSDAALRSPYHALPKAEDAVDVRFTSRLQEDVGRSLHVFLESLESAQTWTCRSPGNPVVLNWHHGSMASAWHECGERNGSFFDHFSACSSGDAGQPLSCDHAGCHGHFVDGTLCECVCGYERVCPKDHDSSLSSLARMVSIFSTTFSDFVLCTTFYPEKLDGPHRKESQRDTYLVCGWVPNRGRCGGEKSRWILACSCEWYALVDYF